MTPDERRRWTDERLDDRFNALETQMQLTTKNIAEDVAEIKILVVQQSVNLTDTARALAAQELKQERAKAEERGELSRERKSDRRWLVATVISMLMFIIAAISVLGATGVFG